ncbi:hypothetical protein OHA70_35220 [Kribbella sp. NBC_00382]|uniref:hypothetical protein n=1 Tax=Kribbella sp. NBC_00382 TaxID=2975967 RepID=UPI002E22440C
MTGFIIFVVLMIIFGFGRNAANKQKKSGQPSPRVQALMAKIQAQQAASQAPVQGQYTQPASGQPLPDPQQSGRAQSSAQLAGMLQSLLQAGQQAGQRPGVPVTQYAPPVQFQPAPSQYEQPATGQYQPAPVQQYQPTPSQYAAPGQFQPQWQPQYQQHHAEHSLPAPNSPLENRVRELMKSGNEVPAIRLLCDEQDLGIIEAQKYARSLIAPAAKPGQAASDGDRPERDVDENRYVGSAAFAESVFDLDRDENVWASGWVEKPEPDDRSDMDELWQTVRNAGRPTTPPS